MNVGICGEKRECGNSPSERRSPFLSAAATVATSFAPLSGASPTTCDGHDIKELPGAEWPAMTATQAMMPLAQVKRIQPGEGLWAAIEELDHDGVNQLPVVTNGHSERVLRRQDIISYLRNLQDLG